MVFHSDTITTTLRLADNSTVPIVLRPTPSGWLSAVLIDGEQIKHCRNGHILINATMHIEKDGYRRCDVCKRMRRARWAKAHRDKQLAYYKRYDLTRRATLRR